MRGFYDGVEARNTEISEHLTNTLNDLRREKKEERRLASIKATIFRQEKLDIRRAIFRNRAASNIVNARACKETNDDQHWKMRHIVPNPAATEEEIKDILSDPLTTDYLRDEEDAIFKSGSKITTQQD